MTLIQLDIENGLWLYISSYLAADWLGSGVVGVSSGLHGNVHLEENR